jgi:acetyl-CoA carboxylase biotin carboxyl carrier protein
MDVARRKKFMKVAEEVGGALSMELEEIERLAEMMARCGLDRLELERGDCRLRLGRRGGRSSADAAADGRNFPQCAAEPAPVPREEIDLRTVFSPMIGSFYRSPSPGHPAFVEVGSAVSVDSTVCIIEAMKVMNEIPADVDGTVVEVLAKDGQAVEFGQPLFKVTPRT